MIVLQQCWISSLNDIPRGYECCPWQFCDLKDLFTRVWISLCCTVLSMHLGQILGILATVWPLHSCRGWTICKSGNFVLTESTSALIHMVWHSHQWETYMKLILLSFWKMKNLNNMRFHEHEHEKYWTFVFPIILLLNSNDRSIYMGSMSRRLPDQQATSLGASINSQRSTVTARRGAISSKPFKFTPLHQSFQFILLVKDRSEKLLRRFIVRLLTQAVPHLNEMNPYQNSQIKNHLRKAICSLI